MGAKVTADLTVSERISPDEGAFLLSFCNNMSPMFILGVLFRNYIPEHALHLPFFLILTGSPLLCSQMFRLYYTHKPRIHSEEYRRNRVIRATRKSFLWHNLKYQHY